MIKTARIRIESMTFKYPTIEGGQIQLINLLNNQCPKCLEVVSMTRKPEFGPDIIVIESCRCEGIFIKKHSIKKGG